MTQLPRCFFDIAINGIPTGRIVFELFTNQCPKTCENFRCLCSGEKGEGKTTFKPLHYKGTPIHRIVKGFIVQGGDFVNGDGTGGESIYGSLFDDENLKLKHDKKLLLSMANKGPNTNGSQFFITTRPAPHLDGIHVVFGQVVDGHQFVLEIENQKVDASHRPYADVRISNCGELVLMKRGKAVGKKKTVVSVSPSESESDSESDELSSSSSEEERRSRKKRRSKKEPTKKSSKKKRVKESSKKRKRHTKHRRKKHKKQDSSESSDSDGDGNKADEAVTSTIREEDLPPEISTTVQSWLFRSSKSPSPKSKEGDEERERKRKSWRGTMITTCVNRENEVSNSGRKLRGRGMMRYQTPPRESEPNNWPSHREPFRSWGEAPRRRHHSHSRSRSRSRESRRRRRSLSRERSPGYYHHSHRQERSRSRDRRHRHRSRSHTPSDERYSRRRSRSPRSQTRRHRRSASHSPSRRNGSPHQRSRTDSKRRRESGSKWARHRDSRSEDSGSESGSDRELEKTYQRAERNLVEQQFGIDDLLPQ